MKLQQKLEINGVNYAQESSGDIFGLLQAAQLILASQRPDLDPLWLQHHPSFLHYLGCLAHAGKVSIFSLQDQVDMSITWTWVMDRVHALPEPRSQAAQDYRDGCDAPVVGE